MKTIEKTPTKRERKAAQLLRHYATCECLALACGLPASKVNGKRISVKLMQLEHIVSLCSVAYCNGERLKVSEGGFQDSLMPEYLDFGADGPKAWERVKTRATDSVRNILGDIPPGFFVTLNTRRRSHGGNMGIAAYNRGSRAISAYFDQQARERQTVAPITLKSTCTHLETRCKYHPRNRNLWCPECRTWFWHGWKPEPE